MDYIITVDTGYKFIAHQGINGVSIKPFEEDIENAYDRSLTLNNDAKYLAHYGVKGMKWGELNAETRAKYANAGNGTYYKKAQRGDAYGRSVTDKRREYNANQSKGKQLAKYALMGPSGARAYNTSRSRGLGRTESLRNAALGEIYTQGVKAKQRGLGKTEAMVSKSAKARGEYTKNESLGKSLVKGALAGTGVSEAYNSSRASGSGRVASAAKGALLGNFYNAYSFYRNPQQVKASDFKRNKPVLEEHQDARKEFHSKKKRV